MKSPARLEDMAAEFNKSDEWDPSQGPASTISDRPPGPEAVFPRASFAGWRTTWRGELLAASGAPAVSRCKGLCCWADGSFRPRGNSLAGVPLGNIGRQCR
jgi:hypothetical protein